MRKAISKNLSKRQLDEPARLAALPENEIDTSDIPEIRDWRGAKRGRFYRPAKQQLTLRIDADVVDWFRSSAPAGRGYQTNINEALREYVERRRRKSG